ncbi:putative photosynthetic complex assembly protein PuhE [Aurantiacibacter odishensis]|uniref:putative photosynthetic complex assembly protein PuhE n=1 Tax=Aurantiacibacter odishensis TaxID=1155476 RepID=UPI000E72E8F2|nr:putative photosynthetic complex assembly protein PuhE [Aurantiacibacter odishensis]
MVSWSGHILPVVATIAMWFFATGLIAWLDNRERATFPRSLAWAGVAGVAGLVAVVASMHTVSLGAVYLSFAGAILIWAWHEIGFLTGAIAGPRREPCPPDARGWDRFGHASAAMAWHEIALALTALVLIALTWSAPNQVGAMVFLLLFVLRLSTKLNIFVGVPNMSTEIIPPHLAYLQSYFGPRRLHPLLVASVIGNVALATWLGLAALQAAPGSAEAAGASLLFALAALGALEHLFLALPFRDGALWKWAIPARGHDTQTF